MSAAPFLVTFFEHHGARFRTEREINKAELADLVRTHHASSKDQLHWVKLARFGTNATSKGSLRHDANMINITGVEVDYDGEEMSFEDARLILEEAGVDCIIYTSPSHTPEKPRWRVLAPLSRPHRPHERAKFVARINGLFGGIFDGASFTMSQSYYFGYVVNGAGAVSAHRVETVDGDCVDELDSLDETAIGKGKKKSNGGGDYRAEFVELEEHFGNILSGKSLHPSVTAIAGKMALRKTARETCIELVKSLFDSCPDPRYHDPKERWPECRQAIDDIYDKEEKKAEEAARPKDLPPDIVLDDFYAYLPKHWYLYVPTQTLWPPATINSRLAKVDGIKATRHLDKSRAVSQMIWAPGHGCIVYNKHLIEGGWIEKPGAIVFNQYRQPPELRGDPALAGPWLDLLKRLYPNAFEHEHLLDALAFKLQHPDVKINHALVLGGGMRIGKDTLLLPFKRALGSWNCVEARPTTIMSAFNGYMRSVLLVINEARDLGDVKKHQFYDHMKDVIVTPPETVLVNEKHEKGVHVANVCLVVMTTNHRTDSLYLPPGDGRHFVVWSDVEKESYEEDFFTRHYRWLREGGVGHVAAFLRARDVSGFDPGRPPPLTEVFHEIVEQSTPTEVYWLDGILDGMGRPDVLIIPNLITHADGDQAEWLRKNPKAVPHRLNDCGYVRVAKPGSENGRWMIAGKRQNVYGRKDLSTKDRVAAVVRWEGSRT